jgi:hypothetical protein
MNYRLTDGIDVRVTLDFKEVKKQFRHLSIIKVYNIPKDAYQKAVNKHANKPTNLFGDCKILLAVRRESSYYSHRRRRIVEAASVLLVRIRHVPNGSAALSNTRAVIVGGKIVSKTRVGCEKKLKFEVVVKRHSDCKVSWWQRK